MRLLTECKMMTVAVLMAVPVLTHAQAAESNPAQVVAIGEGQKLVNDQINSQTTGMQKTAARQGAIATEFTIMKGWESKDNSYLKTARGYAEAIQAGTTLYADGFETL